MMTSKPEKLLSADALLNAHRNTEKSITKLGLKEFEPTGLWLERKQIESVLLERKDVLDEERVEKWGSMAGAIWDPQKKLAEVNRRIGKHFQTMGFVKKNKLYLYPEEALFLLEMNNLELLFGGVPMSIQQAYNILLQSGTGCGINEYRTYSHLVRQGYRVLRFNNHKIRSLYEDKPKKKRHCLPGTLPNPFGNNKKSMDGNFCEIIEHRPTKKEKCSPQNNDGCLKTADKQPESNSSCCNAPEKSNCTESRESLTVENPECKSVPNFQSEATDLAKSLVDLGNSLIERDASKKCEESEPGPSKRTDLTIQREIIEVLGSHFQGDVTEEALTHLASNATQMIIHYISEKEVNKETANAKSVTQSTNDSNADSCLAIIPEKQSEADEVGKQSTCMTTEENSKLPSETNPKAQEIISEKSTDNICMPDETETCMNDDPSIEIESNCLEDNLSKDTNACIHSDMKIVTDGVDREDREMEAITIPLVEEGNNNDTTKRKKLNDEGMELEILDIPVADKSVELIDIADDMNQQNRTGLSSDARESENVVFLKKENSIEVIDIDDSSVTSDSSSEVDALPKLTTREEREQQKRFDMERMRILNSFPNMYSYSSFLLYAPDPSLLPDNVVPKIKKRVVAAWMPTGQNECPQRNYVQNFPPQPRFPVNYNQQIGFPHVPAVNAIDPMLLSAFRYPQFSPFPAPGANSEFPVPSANPEFPVPSANLQFPFPGANPRFPVPGANPRFPVPGVNPQFPAPRGNGSWVQRTRPPWQNRPTGRGRWWRPRRPFGRIQNRRYYNREIPRFCEEETNRVIESRSLPTSQPDNANQPFKNNTSSETMETEIAIDDDSESDSETTDEEGDDSDASGSESSDDDSESGELSPLLKQSNCSNFGSIMKSLQVIKQADVEEKYVSLKINYDVYRPNTPFRKANPLTPSYRLCITSVNEPVPSFSEISTVLNKLHDGVPLLFAVVSDDVSFYHYTPVNTASQLG